MSRKEKGLRLSPRWGVNPTIPRCFYCNKDKNELILMGEIMRHGKTQQAMLSGLRGTDQSRDFRDIDKEDPKAPMGMVFDREPCDECAKLMEQGVILISVRDGQGGDNPYRTGGWVVVTEGAIKNITAPELAEQILKKRVAFIPDEAWKLLGLPMSDHQLKNVS